MKVEQANMAQYTFEDHPRTKPTDKYPIQWIWIRVPARFTGVKGLFIHYSFRDPTRYTVSHGVSGLAVANFKDKKSAFRFARRIGKLGDWLQDHQAIQNWPKKTKNRIEEIRKEFEGSRPGGSVLDK